MTAAKPRPGGPVSSRLFAPRGPAILGAENQDCYDRKLGRAEKKIVDAMSKDEKFLKQLRAEIADTQQRRASFVRGKLAFVVGLLGAGAITIDGRFEATTLLYLVPLVAFVFDLYILGEDFSIKRIAVFIRTSPAASGEEKLWETGVDQRRDWFSYWAGPLSSVVVLTAAAVGIKASSATIVPFLPWLSVNLLFIVFLIAYRPIRIRSLKKFEELLGKEDRCAASDS